MHLSQITPSIFSSLGLDSAADHLAMGQSPMGRELLFLIDGFGYDTLSTYADVMPTMSRMFNHGLVQTSFPSTTATLTSSSWLVSISIFLAIELTYSYVGVRNNKTCGCDRVNSIAA